MRADWITSFGICLILCGVDVSGAKMASIPPNDSLIAPGGCL
jgi:hypothetical protein